MSMCFKFPTIKTARLQLFLQVLFYLMEES